MDILKDGWFSEVQNEFWPGQMFSMKVTGKLHEEKSKYQHILILNTEAYGTTLILDGIIQTTERDEFSYHEMMTFLPLCSHACPKKVLIVGGGDGGIAREVVKHPSVEEVHLVEIDERVIALSKEYLPDLACGLRNPKVKVIVADGFEYLKQRSNEYDVIITDSSDPIGPSINLFQESYFELLKKALRKGGIICSQGGSYWLDYNHVKKSIVNCRKHFPVVGYAVCSVASYPCGSIGFVIGSLNEKTDFKDPKWKFSPTEIDDMNLKFYTSNMHTAAFALPRLMEKHFYDSEQA